MPALADNAFADALVLRHSASRRCANRPDAFEVDLAQRLLAEMGRPDEGIRKSIISKGQAWAPRREYRRTSYERAGSPWEGRIQRPNSRKIGEV